MSVVGVARSVGSSPRARGTRCRLSCQTGRRRFIPASAGNTILGSVTDLDIQVHPRERGEHPAAPLAERTHVGSSPRARGTRDPTNREIAALRFIPASAGNTFQYPAMTRSSSVHPRERGEHALRPAPSSPPSGSSPRARGTREVNALMVECQRFIPASAGNTRRTSRWQMKYPVHPRERGEH